MTDLIALLEKATEPDRELDAALYALSRGLLFEMRDGQVWAHYHHRDDPGATWHRMWKPRGQESISYAPFTRSIDDALTLVPDGFQAYVDTGLGPGHAHACVWTDYPHRIQGGARQMPSPALALCVAALKARSALSTTMRDTR